MNRSSMRSLIRYSARSLSSAALVAVLLVSLNLLTTGPASAAIYKCISGTGSVTYSGRKCPDEDTTARIIADSGIGSARSRRAPAAATPDPVAVQSEKEKRQRDAELDPQPE